MIVKTFAFFGLMVVVLAVAELLKGDDVNPTTMTIICVAILIGVPVVACLLTLLARRLWRELWEWHESDLTTKRGDL